VNLKCDIPVSKPFAFHKCNLYRYSKALSDDEKDEWCIASEDSAFGPLGFTRVRDVNPGEAILITPEVGLVQVESSCDP
jgi:glutamine phosphoribosylpyrophosphate amidotransferase